PGTAIDGSGNFTFQSYFGGVRSSFEAIAISQVICWPVYAAMRPMIASNVLFAMYSPLAIGLPARMLAKSSSCSVWYIWLPGQGYDHSFAVRIARPSSRSESVARPRVPMTWALRSLLHFGCWRVLLMSRTPLLYSYTTEK